MNWLKEFFKKIMPEKAAEIDAFVIPEPAELQKPEIKPNGNDNEKLLNEIALLKTELAESRRELKELREAQKIESETREAALKKMQADKIQKTIEDAIKAGKITPDSKEKWIKRLESNYEETADVINDLPSNPAVNKRENVTPQQTAPQGGTLKSKNPILETILSRNNIIN